MARYRISTNATPPPQSDRQSKRIVDWLSEQRACTASYSDPSTATPDELALLAQWRKEHESREPLALRLVIPSKGPEPHTPLRKLRRRPNFPERRISNGTTESPTYTGGEELSRSRPPSRAQPLAKSTTRKKSEQPAQEPSPDDSVSQGDRT